MAQWQEVQHLANAHLERVHQLYAAAALPMAVRQSLADWIEDQDWQQAAEPFSSHARMLFHSLLALLGERLGSLGPGDNDFMLKHNLRKARRDLQAAFEDCPETFANLVANLLQEERQILRQGQAGGQVEAAAAPSAALQSDREQEIQQRLAELRTALQEAERAFRHLENLQEAFDFSYKLYYQPGQDHSNDPQYMQQVQALQAKLQTLDRQRREVVAQIQQLLGRSETLRDFLQQELGAWRERQRRSCLGAPVDTCLLQLQTWFTALGEGLFQLLQLLRALAELRQKVTYERDPLQAEMPLLETRLQEQLTSLLQSAFVVEQQPCMPNTPKRPLVLRTASKFCTRARLLVRLYDRNHRMEATIHIDRDPPKTRGFRKFNILTSSSKTVLAGDSHREGLVCDFQYLTLKEQKGGGSGKGSRGSSEGPLVVTEELHLITFTLAYAYCGLELKLETCTLPFVIISNNNQLSSAWASILWFNMLSTNPKDQQFFAAPPPAPWPQLAEVLSWQFQSVAERGLGREHLHMLAEKLFGSKPSPENVLAWPKFSKDGAAGFSFWAWLDGILALLHEHLKQLWKDGLILGFVSRKQEKKLLKGKRTGTFLIRFSESVLGGVTCTWVEHPESGPPAFRAVVPYTAAELASLALPDIIRDYQLLAEENIPENPLLFLYPDTARDEAFGPYYSQRQDEILTEKKAYLNQRLIRVSSRQPHDAWQTQEELVVATENLETLQLKPGGLQPVSPGTLPGVAGSPGTPQAASPGLWQPTSPGTLQPRGPGTSQMVATSPGVQQVVAGSPGTPQVVARSLGTLQPGPQGPVPLSPQQVGPGGLGVLQMGIADLGPQVVLQLLPGGHGTLPAAPGVVGMLQVLPGDTGMLQQVALGDQGTQQVAAGAVEPEVMLQLLPEGHEMLPAAPGEVGVLQAGSGAAELPIPAAQGLLPPELGDLDLLQLLETEPGVGGLEAAELLPPMDGVRGVAGGLFSADPPCPAGSTVLLDPHDPFLPQPEDTALPATSSLFAVDTDFPPLHIDSNDFQ